MTHLPWSTAVAPFLVACALMLLPGLAVGWAARLRPALLLALAPAVSLGVIALAGVGSGALGLGWSVVAVAVTTLVVGLVAGGLVRGLRADPLGARWPSGRTGWLLALGPLLGLLLATALQGRRLLTSIGSADAVAQSYDTTFHLNGVALILETGNASPLAMTLATPGSESGFYPNLWHSIAAILVQVTGAGIPTATNALALATTLLVWPLSTMALVWVVFGPRPFPLTVSALLVFAFPHFPNRFLSFGILYPNLLAYAALPAALALVLLVLRALGVGSPRGGGRLVWLGPVGLLLVALPGLSVAHPSGTVAWVVLAACALLVSLARWTWRRLGRRRAGARQPVRTAAGHHAARSQGGLVAVGVAWAATIAALVVGVVAIQTLPALAVLRPRVLWGTQLSFSQATQSLLDLSTASPPTGGQPIGTDTSVPLVAALVLVGLVLAIVTPRWRWLVLGYGVVAGLWIACVALNSPLREALVTFWYGDQIRLAALLPVLGLPLAVLGVESLVRVATRVRARRWAVAAAALAVIALLDVASGRFPAVRDSFDRIAWMHGTWPGQTQPDLLTEEEAAFLDDVAQVVPNGEAVVVNPWDGGALLWALEDVPVVFPVPNASLDADRALVAGQLAQADTDPAVCDALAELDTSYVLVLGAPIWDPEGDPARPDLGFSGLYGLDGVAELVQQDGDLALFRVTACA
ncbi:DUF6541 family protein [Salana multivorans]